MSIPTVSPNAAGGAQNVNASDMGGVSQPSVQFRFAKLQMLLAQLNRDKAISIISTIEASQKLAREAADMVARAREMQANAPTGEPAKKDVGGGFFGALFSPFLTIIDMISDSGNDDCGVYVPSDMKGFFAENGLSWQGGGTKEDWEYNIKSLTNFQETIGTDTQQKMVYVNDFMGQYNAYLSGSNSTLRDANQTLLSIAKNQ